MLHMTILILTLGIHYQMMVVQGKAGCTLALESRVLILPQLQSSTYWMQLQRVDAIPSVEVHITVLQKVSMLYFVNNFSICYEITRTFIFNILSFLLDRLSPTICKIFHVIRKKGL
jgi:hypothetical protein